jgi:uncharacterized membrane protein (DUF4010 family)
MIEPHSLDPNNALALLPDILLALAIGLVIGAEREWSQRARQTDRVTAGIRTFGLLGLLGSLSVILSAIFHPMAWMVILIGVVLMVVVGYIAEIRASGDWGMTTEIAMLMTYVLGALATQGYAMLAAGTGVVVAALLALKQVLHARVHRLESQEIAGSLKLLFISVVMLPLLPNQPMGPWDVFNPYVVWWMVVLIAALGFMAYVAMRWAGPHSGILVTATLGGMVSSTAMTLTLSRLAQSLNQPNLLAAGLLLTSALMFPRVLIEVAVLSPIVLTHVAAPLGTAIVVYLFGTGVYAWCAMGRSTTPHKALDKPLQNPFEIAPALKFTVLLVAMLFAVEAAHRLLGQTGVYYTALLAGALDVDAITLSLARMSANDLPVDIAADGILLAALSNSVIKLILAAAIAGAAVFWRLLPVVVLATLAGLAVWWF